MAYVHLFTKNIIQIECFSLSEDDENEKKKHSQRLNIENCNK